MERNPKILKWLDRYLGIPLISCLSLFRKKRIRPETIDRVGIFAFAAIGDSILSSVLITSIKKQYPLASVTIFASKANVSIYSVMTGFDKLVQLPVTRPWLAAPILRQHPVDILIDTSQWSRLGALYCLFAKAKWAVGFRTPGQCRAGAYDAVVEHSNDCHELENFQKLLVPLGVNPSDTLALSGNLKNPADLENGLAVGKYIVIHPWASGSHSDLREWPASSWVSLAKDLIGRGVKVLISGSLADRQKAKKLAQAIDEGNEVKVIAGEASFQSLCNLLMHARGCISVNTGIAHLAAGLGVPTMALNGPTNPKRWGILGKNVTNINVLEGQGGGFLNLGFEYPPKSQYIMNQIMVDSVLDALNQWGID